MGSLRTFVLTFLISLAIILGLTQWMVFKTHQAQLSPERWQSWPAGQVYALPTYDKAIFTHSLAASAPAAKIAVIGSSHFNYVRSQALPGALNLAMGGTGLEYDVSVWQDLLDLDKRPDAVLLCADPFLINGHQIPDPLWARDNGRLSAFVLRSAMSPGQKAAWLWQDLGDRFHRFFMSALGWFDLRRAIWILGHKPVFGFCPVAEVVNDPLKEAYFQDGSTLRQEWDRPQQDPKAFSAGAVRESLAHMDRRYDRWEPSERRRALLKALLVDMHAHGTQVFFLGTPENSESRAYNQRRHPRAFPETLTLLKDLQAQGLIDRLSIQWDGRTCGCSEDQFIDGDHTIVQCMDQAVKTLR